MSLISENALLERETNSSQLLCFFCSQDSTKQIKRKARCKLRRTKSLSVVNNNVLSLRHLSRFLKVFEDYEDDPFPLKQKLHAFANLSLVPVCENCSKLMKEFTSLYNVLEETRVKLEWCVQKIHIVMSKTNDRDQFESVSVQTKRLEQEEINDSENLMASLKTKIFDKMKVLNSLRQPRVRLTKANIPSSSSFTFHRKQTEPVDRQSSNVVNAASESTKSPSEEPVEIQLNTLGTATSNPSTEPITLDSDVASSSLQCSERVLPQGLLLNANEPSSSSSTSHRIEIEPADGQSKIPVEAITEFPQSPFTSNPTEPSIAESDESAEKEAIASDIQPPSLKCSYCRAHFPEKFSWMLRQHIFQYHCEHFFKYERLKSVTDQEYKKILAELLFKDLITGHGSCSFCEKKFLKRREGPRILLRLKLHLVKSHHPELRKKLMVIQNDPDLPDTLASCNPQGSVCRCGAYLHDLKNQTRHDKFHCNLVHNDKNELTQQQTEQINQGESQTETISNARVDEQQQSSIPSVQEPALEPLPGIANSKPKTRKVRKKYKTNFIQFAPGKVKVMCKLCRKIINGKSIRWHSKYSCAPLQGLPIEKKVIITASEDENPLSCEYCRVEFRRTNVNREEHKLLFANHLVRFHPEHFFLDVRDDPTTATATVTKDQFQRIIHNILFPAFLPKHNNGTRHACPLCRRKFTVYNKSSIVKLDCHFKKHLVECHRNKLACRLREILKDPQLMETLKTFDDKGLSCACGMYLPESGAVSKNYHEKYHCKLVTRKTSSDDLPSEKNGFAEAVRRTMDAKLDKDRVFPSSSNDPVIITVETEDSNDIAEANIGVNLDSSPRPQLANENSPKPKPNLRRLKKHYLTCSYCKAKFQTGSQQRSGYRIREHMAQYHLEHLFPNQKLEFITQSQYQIILAELLFRNLVGEKTTTCLFCNMLFTNQKTRSLSIKSHMIQSHCRELEERLERIQRDPNIKETLNKCNPRRRLCLSCGLYLTDPIRLKLHERFHCTKKWSNSNTNNAPELAHSNVIGTATRACERGKSSRNIGDKESHSVGVENRLGPSNANKCFAKLRGSVKSSEAITFNVYVDREGRLVEMENTLGHTKPNNLELEVGANTRGESEDNSRKGFSVEPSITNDLEPEVSKSVEDQSADVDKNSEGLPMEIEDRLERWDAAEPNPDVCGRGYPIKDVSVNAAKDCIDFQMESAKANESAPEVRATAESADIIGYVNGDCEVLPIEMEEILVQSKDNESEVSVCGESNKNVLGDCDGVPDKGENSLNYSKARKLNVQMDENDKSCQEISNDRLEDISEHSASEPEPEQEEFAGESSEDISGSIIDKYCEGIPEDVSVCNNRDCEGIPVEMEDIMDHSKANEPNCHASESCGEFSGSGKGLLPIDLEDQLKNTKAGGQDISVDERNNDSVPMELDDNTAQFNAFPTELDNYENRAQLSDTSEQEIVDGFGQSKSCEPENSVGERGGGSLEVLVFNTSSTGLLFPLDDNTAQFSDENSEADSDVIFLEEFEFCSNSVKIKTEPEDSPTEDFDLEQEMLRFE